MSAHRGSRRWSSSETKTLAPSRSFGNTPSTAAPRAPQPCWSNRRQQVKYFAREPDGCPGTILDRLGARGEAETSVANRRRCSIWRSSTRRQSWRRPPFASHQPESDHPAHVEPGSTSSTTARMITGTARGRHGHLSEAHPAPRTPKSTHHHYAKSAPPDGGILHALHASIAGR